MFVSNVSLPPSAKSLSKPKQVNHTKWEILENFSCKQCLYIDNSKQIQQ